MGDKNDSPRYNEKRPSLKRERSHMSEHRYETLQSLSRLVENDFKSEIQETGNRRVSLPTLTHDFMPTEPTPGHWRRNSSVVDYMQELTSIRRELIQRLVPHIENKEADADKNMEKSDIILGSSERDVSAGNLRRNGQLSPVNNSIKSDQEFQLQSCTGSDEMDASDKDDTLRVIQEKMAKFESMKSIPRRSINADDFQQFLGARYLEIYQKRSKRNCVSNDICESYNYEQDTHKKLTRHKNGIKETSKAQHIRPLNFKLHSLVREHNISHGSTKDLDQHLKITLPPILKDRESDRKCLLPSNRSALQLNSTYPNGFVPIHNDLVDESEERRRTKGVPHHTATRAHKRYHESREIHSILNELRKLSSTVQKSEQEKFIHKLDDDYY